MWFWPLTVKTPSQCYFNKEIRRYFAGAGQSAQATIAMKKGKKVHAEKDLKTAVKKATSNMPVPDADERIQRIAKAFSEIMDALGLDLSDDSLMDTPQRVAKMYVQELFRGLDPANAPELSSFDNHYQYGRMLVEKNISIKSTCEHHFMPILGKAHLGYISNGRVIGLSKINRIIDYFARRPQVQERLTKEIFEAFREALNTSDIIIVIDATHLCVSARGVEDTHCTTFTWEYGGYFEAPEARKEFFAAIQLPAMPSGINF